MSVFVTSLNSGSNGNCYYVGTETEAILVDAGISCRETEKRLKRLGLSIYNVKAIFISHEHADHIRGVVVLAKKFNLPVYITTATLRNTKLFYENLQLETFLPHEPIQIGGITVTAFPKFHDAIDPHSFVVNCNKVNIGVFTDIGAPCKHVIHYFKQCHAIFLEANYDDEMLANGYYPQHLKRRISGNKGHLSNLQALELFKKHRPRFMSHVFLSHLSKDNNSPELAKNLFAAHAGKTEIIIASRFEETAVYAIGSKTADQQSIVKLPAVSVFKPKSVKPPKKAPAAANNQLSLFDPVSI